MLDYSEDLEDENEDDSFVRKSSSEEENVPDMGRSVSKVHPLGGMLAKGSLNKANVQNQPKP